MSAVPSEIERLLDLERWLKRLLSQHAPTLKGYARRTPGWLHDHLLTVAGGAAVTALVTLGITHLVSSCTANPSIPEARAQIRHNAETDDDRSVTAMQAFDLRGSGEASYVVVTHAKTVNPPESDEITVWNAHGDQLDDEAAFTFEPESHDGEIGYEFPRSRISDIDPVGDGRRTVIGWFRPSTSFHGYPIYVRWNPADDDYEIGSLLPTTNPEGFPKAFSPLLRKHYRYIERTNWRLFSLPVELRNIDGDEVVSSYGASEVLVHAGPRARSAYGSSLLMTVAFSMEPMGVPRLYEIRTYRLDFTTTPVAVVDCDPGLDAPVFEAATARGAITEWWKMHPFCGPGE
jgi:hypothetical protein